LKTNHQSGWCSDIRSVCFLQDMWLGRSRGSGCPDGEFFFLFLFWSWPDCHIFWSIGHAILSHKMLPVMCTPLILWRFTRILPLIFHIKTVHFTLQCILQPGKYTVCTLFTPVDHICFHYASFMYFAIYSRVWGEGGPYFTTPHGSLCNGNGKVLSEWWIGKGLEWSNYHLIVSDCGIYVEGLASYICP
jgi:hypothetical protein